MLVATLLLSILPTIILSTPSLSESRPRRDTVGYEEDGSLVSLDVLRKFYLTPKQNMTRDFAEKNLY